MKIGFTGTRHGMTSHQQISAIALMEDLVADRNLMGNRLDQFHHGACIGADEEMLVITRNMFGLWTVAHPSDMPHVTTKLASDETRESKPPLERNRDIVDESDFLIATPETFEEVLRSGTWATIRYAKRLKRPITYIWPDGTGTK